jgi:hypothetical protein
MRLSLLGLFLAVLVVLSIASAATAWFFPCTAFYGILIVIYWELDEIRKSLKPPEEKKP